MNSNIETDLIIFNEEVEEALAIGVQLKSSLPLNIPVECRETVELLITSLQRIAESDYIRENESETKEHPLLVNLQKGSIH